MDFEARLRKTISENEDFTIFILKIERSKECESLTYFVEGETILSLYRIMLKITVSERIGCSEVVIKNESRLIK